MKIFYKILIFVFSFLIFSSCSRDKSPITGYSSDAPSDSVHVKKPNIYIYPTKKIELNVKISFPMGGRITASEPIYENTGWHVSVDPTGLIANQYSFLFYECTIPNRFQTSAGWCVQQNKLGTFFTSILTDYGLNEKEISDFNEYWLPSLNEFDYYRIYPQTNEIIEQLVKLTFSKQPDNLFRLFFLFTGTNENCADELEIPEINTCNRNGFTIVEWGGSLENF